MVEGEGRPKTTAMVARRMVSSALGIRVALSNEQREREQQELQAARGEQQIEKEFTHTTPPLQKTRHTRN